MCKGYKIDMVRTGKEKYALGTELIESIREIDKYEMNGMGFTTEQGIRTSMNDCTPVYYARAVDNGKLIACWGLVVLIGKEKNTYVIWALGTNELERFRKSFMKESTAILSRWVNMYKDLTNTVATKNKKAVAWLKRLGAEFEQPFLYNGVEYVNFHLKKKEDASCAQC